MPAAAPGPPGRPLGAFVTVSLVTFEGRRLAPAGQHRPLMAPRTRPPARPPAHVRPSDPKPSHRRNSVRHLATWCYRHRRTVLALWLLALVASTGVAKAAGSQYSNSFSLPDTESTRALHLLKAVAPKQSGDTEQIVVATSGGSTLTCVFR